MNTQEMDLVLKYMIEKMDPQSQDDIKEILGGEMPDTAQDAMRKGGFALERWPKRLLKRSALNEQRNKPAGVAQDAKPKTPEFPNNGRLK